MQGQAVKWRHGERFGAVPFRPGRSCCPCHLCHPIARDACAACATHVIRAAYLSDKQRLTLNRLRKMEQVIFCK